jgi:hypothetical protein
MSHLLRYHLTPEEFERTVDRLVVRETDPLTAADEIVRRMGLA